MNIKYDALGRPRLTADQKKELIELTPKCKGDNNFAERLYWVDNGLTDYPRCIECGNKITNWPRGRKKVYSKFCSIACSNSSMTIKNNRKKSIQEKYGVESTLQLYSVKEKARNTRKRKYGTKHHKTKEQEINWLNHLKNRFGEDYSKPIKNNERWSDWNQLTHSEKIKRTIKFKYDAESVSEIPERTEKRRQTCLERYGVEHPKQKHLDQYTYDFLHDDFFARKEHKKLGLSGLKEKTVCDTTTVIRRLHTLKLIKKYVSEGEKELKAWLSSLNILFLSNRKNIIWPYEIDVVIDNKKIGLEFNGLYYHCDKFKNKNYHIDKTKKCTEKGIDLIHIWEDDWINKNDIVKSRIMSYLGMQKRKIYARNCIIKKVDNQTKKEFLDGNHLQGNDSSKICYGAFLDDELVGVMTFSGARFSARYEYEMVRYCTKKYCVGIGLAQKLFSRFIQEYNPKSIVSYADLCWGPGKIYEKLNFRLDHYTGPNYSYFKHNDWIRQNRMLFQKKKLVKKLEFFDSNLTEWENMKLNNYYRIWNCGQAVWIFD